MLELEAHLNLAESLLSDLDSVLKSFEDAISRQDMERLQTLVDGLDLIIEWYRTEMEESEGRYAKRFSSEASDGPTLDEMTEMMNDQNYSPIARALRPGDSAENPGLNGEANETRTREHTDTLEWYTCPS